MPKRTPEKYDYWSCQGCYVDCFRVRVHGRRPRFCDDCRANGMPMRCTFCGASVRRDITRPIRVVACSLECRAALQFAEFRAQPEHFRKVRSRDRGRTRRPWVSGQCAECSEWFLAKANNARFCSKRCSMVWWGREYDVKSGKQVPPAVRQQVYARDAGICQLCGLPVDMTFAGQHALSPSLDHIECRSWALLPDHRPENLRLAHRGCNSSRGNRGI